MGNIVNQYVKFACSGPFLTAKKHAMSKVRWQFSNLSVWQCPGKSVRILRSKCGIVWEKVAVCTGHCDTVQIFQCGNVLDEVMQVQLLNVAVSGAVSKMEAKT